MSTAIPIPPNIGAIAGSQLIGSLLNFLLYGVLAVQVYVYRLSFPRDRAPIKWLVYTVFFLETVMTALNGKDVYFWFGEGFGDVVRFTQPGFSAFYTPLMGSVMASVVQVFFCYRIFIIQPKALWLCLVIALVSLVQAAGGIGGGVLTYLSHNEDHDHNRKIFVFFWLVGDALADILIAGAMAVLLTKARLQQEHKHTQDIVKRIIRMVIETNTLSMVVAAFSLILFYGAPNTTYFICPTMVLAKLYSNTLLVTFNNRAFVRNTGKWNVSDSYSSNNQASPKPLPLSAGLGLNTPAETLTVTYSGKAGAGAAVTVADEKTLP